ncbi:unnamed protein product [Vicia faba]|uniref:DUF4219 domain-containing protein n=1 Tax=Vicia faba TaxID=3906 RepID=A0AAV1AH87_VICFA|nr:unnamed protein product [Vicia faba]
MTTTNSNSIFSHTTNQISVFNGEHYDYWNSQLEIIFITQDLWEVVEEGYAERQSQKDASCAEDKEKSYKENVMKNATTLRLVQQVKGGGSWSQNDEGKQQLMLSAIQRRKGVAISATSPEGGGLRSAEGGGEGGNSESRE